MSHSQYLNFIIEWKKIKLRKGEKICVYSFGPAEHFQIKWGQAYVVGVIYFP